MIRRRDSKVKRSHGTAVVWLVSCVVAVATLSSSAPLYAKPESGRKDFVTTKRSSSASGKKETAQINSSTTNSESDDEANAELEEDAKKEDSTLVEYSKAVQHFRDASLHFQQAADAIIDREYRKKREEITAKYHAKIDAQKEVERGKRSQAIESFHAFLKRYPNSPEYTPDALYRLANLLFERTTDEYLLADKKYQEDYEKFKKGKLKKEPEEPERDYSDSIAVFQKILNEYPTYRFIDGAYYLLANAYLQHGSEKESVETFEILVKKYPKSKYAPESWIRIGEYYFQRKDLKTALNAFTNSAKQIDSNVYDKALYKLGWTYFRAKKYPQSIAYFTKLIDWSIEQKIEKNSGSLLFDEAIQYLAVAMSETDWDKDGYRDRDFVMRRVRKYLDTKKEYHGEVLAHLAKDLFRAAYYPETVQVIEYTLKNYPRLRQSPELSKLLFTSLSSDADEEDAYERLTNLGEKYGRNSEWYREQLAAGNLTEIQNADELVKRNLLLSAQWFHSRAQRLRKENDEKKDRKTAAKVRRYYALAAKAYTSYLTENPSDPDTYAIHYHFAESLYYANKYLEAYEEFVKVREMNTLDNIYIEDAAYYAIESMTHVVENAIERGYIPKKVLSIEASKSLQETEEEIRQAIETSEDSAFGKDIVPEPVPKLVLEFITAMDRYVVLNLQNSEDPSLTPKFAFRSAKIYFEFNHFEEARHRLEWIVQNYPSDKVAYFAGSLVLETYRQENNFGALSKYADYLTKVLSGENASSIHADVRAFKLGAIFNSAEKLSEEKRYEESAEEYLRLVGQDPKGKFVAKALNNAAVAYEMIGRYDSAMKLYRRVFEEFPDDPLAIYSLYRVAVNQERFFDYEGAIASYELFYRKFNGERQKDLNTAGLNSFNIETRRQSALRSAAILTEDLQKYKEAAQKYELYASSYPSAEDAAETQWRGVESWRKDGDRERMIDAIKTFIDRFGSLSSQNTHLLEGLIRLGRHAEEVLKDDKVASSYYQRTISAYVASDIQPGSAAAHFAAEAQFRIAEVDFRKWDMIEIKGPLKVQKKLLKQKIEGQKALTLEYEKVFAYRAFDWVIAANYRIGALLQRFAFTLYNVPSPFAEGSEAADIYRTELEDIAIPLEDKAVERYERNVNEARKRQVVNEWTKRTLQQLNKYRPSDYPLFKEEKEYYDKDVEDKPEFITVEGWKKVGGDVPTVSKDSL